MTQIIKLADKLGLFKSIISLGVIICGLIYGLCIFIYKIDTRELTIKTMQEKEQALQSQIDNLALRTDEKYERLMDRIIQNEKNYLVNSTKIDYNFTKLFADLQYIKEKLIDKGLEAEKKK